MPRKRKEELEQEQQIDLSTPVKKETFVTRWFNDYAVNNKEELKHVCNLTSRAAEEQFSMYIKSNNTEVYAVIFYATFQTILKFLKGKQNSYNNFTIQICNSINIGYSNSTNDANEKVGNFMPIMENIGINRTIINDDMSYDTDRTSRNFIRWKELNIKKNVEFYKEIQEHAYELLKSQFKTDTRTSEAIIPLFCTFMDNITSIMKVKFKEADGTDVSEISMNVLGLFDIFYSYDNENNKEIIDYSPNIAMKLALKADDHASRDN